ncbi:hypothetical protein ACFXTN_037651 [Malus domestica]
MNIDMMLFEAKFLIKQFFRRCRKLGGTVLRRKIRGHFSNAKMWFPRQKRTTTMYPKMSQEATLWCMLVKTARNLSSRLHYSATLCSRNCLISLKKFFSLQPTRNSGFLATNTFSSAFFVASVMN